MFKKIMLSTTVAALISSSASALTLKEAIIEAVDTNPVVQERLKNYRATRQDLHIAESEYYPKLDLRASYGRNWAGDLKKDGDGHYHHEVIDQNYGNYTSELKLTQNLFDGFGTMHKVDYQEARILAAAYHYLEKTNDIAFRMTNAYLNVLKAYELIHVAHSAIKINQEIFNKVQDLYQSGLTTESEVKKIESSLYLAKYNLSVQKNNARDAEFNFRRIFGRMPVVSELIKPKLNVPMPQSLERATLYAINHNPSLMVAQYNIKGAQALWKQHKKSFYPKIDLEVSQTYNDISERNSFDTPDDRFKVRVAMNFNLYNGGADTATSRKDISKINQEVEIRRDLKRQVIEGLDLSWDAYKMIALQLKDLHKYNQFAKKTLELYKEEYDLGRRSLLDLLSAQKDLINSRRQIITAKYSHLFAQYRILDAMGLLPLSIVGNNKEVAARVNLYTQNDTEEILDTLPIKLDVDNDKIPDNQDLCDNSVLKDNIMPYGCKKMVHDEDGDGVLDEKDKCPLTPKGVLVSSDGCALDSDNDGIKDYKDKCPNTPDGYPVDVNGCTSSITLTVRFDRASAVIPKKLDDKITVLAQYLKDHPDYHIDVIGHTSREKNSSASYNQKLSQKRANSFKRALIKRGIKPNRISTQGKGYSEPIASNATKQGRAQNRRIEINFIKKGNN